MFRQKAGTVMVSLILVCTLISIYLPIQASGKVKQITDTQDKLEGITEEEKAVLKELFSISQKIEEQKSEEDRINADIDRLKLQTRQMQRIIDSKQKAYDTQLGILKKVLVNYQRGGPATYLEILLKADNLSEFLQSINVIKDISHNVKQLLASLEEQKKALEAEKAKLDEKTAKLAAKKAELSESLAKNQALQEEKEAYLNSLKQDKDYYEQQLNHLELIWADCQSLFPKLATKITGAINEGYFTFKDLNIKFGLTKVNGYLKEEDFNRIFKEKEDLSGINFIFKDHQVIMNVPKEHLILYGSFVISGDSAIRYKVSGGSFYDLPLQQASIDELFREGPLVIDFQAISKGIITIGFTLTEVGSEEGRLTFVINPQW